MALTATSQGGVINPLADQVFAMMQSAKAGDNLGPFVRKYAWPSPEPAFVLAQDWWLDSVQFQMVSRC